MEFHLAVLFLTPHTRPPDERAWLYFLVLEECLRTAGDPPQTRTYYRAPSASRVPALRNRDAMGGDCASWTTGPLSKGHGKRPYLPYGSLGIP